MGIGRVRGGNDHGISGAVAFSAEEAELPVDASGTRHEPLPPAGTGSAENGHVAGHGAGNNGAASAPAVASDRVSDRTVYGEPANDHSANGHSTDSGPSRDGHATNGNSPTYSGANGDRRLDGDRRRGYDRRHDDHPDFIPVRRFTRTSVPGIATAIVGYGYWGPNLARNLAERPEFSLELLCDVDPAQRQVFGARHPEARATPDFDRVLSDDRIEAVVIATPPRSHYSLAKQALLAGKHVLVEKPMATTLANAQDLADTAKAAGLVLMPGHTFVYSPPVNAVRDLISTDVLGDIHFVTSSRMNLGKYQREGVICDLAPHDLSILLYWLEQPIVEVAASGRSAFGQGVHETAFLTLNFASGATANVQISWLAPRKVRQMVIVGSKRMVQYDDTAADESIRVYDRGMEVRPPVNFGEHQLVYRTGDVLIPRIDPAEPLSLELADFAAAIRTGVTPRSSVSLGLEIVAVVEAAAKSLGARGMPVQVPSVAELAVA